MDKNGGRLYVAAANMALINGEGVRKRKRFEGGVGATSCNIDIRWQVLGRPQRGSIRGTYVYPEMGGPRRVEAARSFPPFLTGRRVRPAFQHL